MYSLLTLFFDICRFKKGPQDVPVSKWLLFLLIPIYACVSFLILILSTDVFNAILQIIVEITFVLVSAKVILFLANKSDRYQQTASALIATDSVISFAAIPVMATFINQGSANSIIAITLLMLWHWAVSGHIFSQALEKHLSIGLGIALLYILLAYQLMALLFPEMLVST